MHTNEHFAIGRMHMPSFAITGVAATINVMRPMARILEADAAMAQILAGNNARENVFSVGRVQI